MAAVDRVFSEALALSDAERAALAQQLLLSLEPAEDGAEAAWAREVRRRAAEVRAGSVALQDWPDVLREIARDLQARQRP